jgi:hypothetical protein
MINAISTGQATASWLHGFVLAGEPSLALVLIQANSDERIASSTDISIGCTHARGTNTV